MIYKEIAKSQIKKSLQENELLLKIFEGKPLFDEEKEQKEELKEKIKNRLQSNIDRLQELNS